MTHMLYGKIVLCVVILLAIHLWLIRKLSQLRTYLKSLKMRSDLLYDVFGTFRLKLYIFWILFAFWFVARAFELQSRIGILILPGIGRNSLHSMLNRIWETD